MRAALAQPYSQYAATKPKQRDTRVWKVLQSCRVGLVDYLQSSQYERPPLQQPVIHIMATILLNVHEKCSTVRILRYICQQRNISIYR